LKKLFATPADPTFTIMRIFLAVLFFPHGAQKALGWFGGAGFHGTMHEFTTGLGIPAFFVFFAILAEFAGSILMFVGLLARLAAFGQGVVMLVAIFKVHLHNGLLGTAHGEGYSFPLALFALALLVLIKGAGCLSIDRLIAKLLSR
jgi:putative oxidoreductase